jgi:hypothetical protein
MILLNKKVKIHVHNYTILIKPCEGSAEGIDNNVGLGTVSVFSSFWSSLNTDVTIVFLKCAISELH